MIAIPTLETDRLTLRALTVDDVPDVAAFYASDRSKYVGGPKSADEAWRMVATEIGHWPMRGFGRWAVEERASGGLAGVVGPWEPAGFPEAELGWDLMAGFEGRGYATEAARAARDWVYATLGKTTLISLVAPPNTASARVAARLGAVHEDDFDHAMFGRVQVWRHPGPEAAT